MGNLERVLDQVEDPERRHTTAIRRYGQEHPDSYGGQWTDRLMGGAIVVAFTGEIEAHRAAIAARIPSRTAFDVVQVEYSEVELLGLHHRLGRFMGPDYGLTSVGLGTKRNRVTLHFTDPPLGAMEALARLVPAGKVCAEVSHRPEPPSGPLTVIPNLSVDDPMVTCGRFGPMPYSRFLDPPRLDEVDHPAVERLRAALDSPPGRLLPAGDYRVMDVGDDVVRFAALGDEGFNDVTVILGGGRWRIGGWSGDAYLCEVRVALPPGLGYVDIRRNAETGPASPDGSIQLLVRLSGCIDVRTRNQALRGPQVVETSDEVLVAFAAVGASVNDDCVAIGGFPWLTPVAIELSEPLGTRVLRDGTYLPPRAIRVDSRSRGAHGPFDGPPGESHLSTARTDARTAAATANDTLLACEDVPRLESAVEGSLSGTQNPSDRLIGIIRSYGSQHESFADLWIDRAHGGALVAAFTDDLEIHRQALAALLPAGTPFDVVRAQHSNAELDAARAVIHANVSELEGLSSFGAPAPLNRVEIGFVDPPDATLDRLVELVPAAMVCVDVFYPPEPPSGPLDIIPLANGADPLVECRGIGEVRYSRLVDPISIDEVDHPAVEALRAEIEAPSPEPLPAGEWSVMRIDDDRVTFAVIEGNVIAGRASFRLDGDRWVLSGYGSGGGRPCEARVPLPAGLAHVKVHLDPSTLPRPASTSIFLLVQDIDCSNGREIGDELRGPQIVETDDEVLVAFAVIPVWGGATCEGGPATPVTVKLSRPLGDRALLNGALMPPAPIEPHPDY